MKTILILVCIMLTLPVKSQVSVGIAGGFGQTDITFENLTIGKQSGYVPVSLQVLYGGSVQFGGEVGYSVIPFTFIWKEEGEDGQSLDFKMNQLVLGGLIKVFFGTHDLKPYLRAGLGLYSGDIVLDWSDAAQELGYQNLELDTGQALGFNAGLGVESMVGNTTTLFIEAVYNVVNRDNDETEIMRNIGLIKANNWAVQAGVKFYF